MSQVATASATIIIEHTALPESTPQLRLEESPSLRIGVTEGAEAYQVFRVSDALRRSDGPSSFLTEAAPFGRLTASGPTCGPLAAAARDRASSLSRSTCRNYGETPSRCGIPGQGGSSLFTKAGRFARAWTPPGMAGSAVAVGLAGPDRLLIERRIAEPGVVGGHNALTVDSEIHLLDVERGSERFSGAG